MSIFRTILERASRGRVLKRTIRVKGKRVSFFVSPDAQLKYLKVGGTPFDEDLMDIAERFLKPESVVWDIGANVGVFTFSAAAVAYRGKVVSVEPDIWLASILRRSAALKGNSKLDIRIIPAAVSDSDSVAAFLIAARGRAANALEVAGGRSPMGGTREKQWAPTLRLDTLLAAMPRPDFVKIDVEGAELMAIKGAHRLLESVRPVFYVELGGNPPAEIMDVFSRQRYFAVSREGEVLKEPGEYNVLFIPAENREALQIAGVDAGQEMTVPP